ncbi:GOLPH3/VPS74 family protein [Actinomadura sp. HBU206391]|uniref:GOLPH3/VPS74 family protein n=1 Tax=Actinomadura sp. HBU206391 TaxID=2731692 RepID=UPI00164F96B1|nr:GPP34 family phosphoprotein [Actinomadura sp. HBU206391]MBC6457161.1 GPP34 family phosphoprotein [Actinomadura sp. HBU206391]
MTDTNLTIAEAFVLLSLREENGKPLIGSTEAVTAVAGALLTDLVIAGRLGIDDDDRITCTDPSPTGDPELDAALSRIAEEKKQRKAKWWVSKLRSESLRKRLTGRLAERGILREERGRVLGVFPTTRYPEQDPVPEQQIRADLRSAIDGARPNAHTACLFALIHACKLDRKIFPDVAKSLLKQRAQEMAEGEWAGAAVRKVISEVHAATTAVLVATTTATTAGSS